MANPIHCKLKGEGCKGRFRPTRSTQKYCEVCSKQAGNANRAKTPKERAAWPAKARGMAESQGFVWVGFEGNPWPPSSCRVTLKCPIHGVFQPSNGYEALKGLSGCLECAGRAFKYAYILILNDGAVDRAVKFGITNTPISRVSTLNQGNKIKARIHRVYEFNTTQLCTLSERCCKQTLDTGVVAKYEMQDGYTETTYTSNLDEIEAIYQDYGGFDITKQLLKTGD